MREGKKKGFLDMLHPARMDYKEAKNVEQISVIGHSCDAVGWRPIPYTIPEEFAAFHADVENDVSALIQKAHPDMYNVRFYDETVQAALRTALDALESQRTEHMRGIYSIRTYQEASRTDLELDLARLEDALRRKEEMNE